MSFSHTEWISNFTLGHRLWETALTFMLGETGDIIARPEHPLLAALPALLAAAALVLVFSRGDRGERRAASIPLALGAVTVLVPVAIGLLDSGKDFVLARNLIPALVPLLVAVAVGFSLRRARRAGAILAGVLVAYSLGFSVWASISPALQRPDWDAVAAELGEPTVPRAMVTWTLGEASLRYYLSTGSIQVQADEGFDWRVARSRLRLRRPGAAATTAAARSRLPPGRLREGRPALRAALCPARLAAGQAAPGAGAQSPAWLPLQRGTSRWHRPRMTRSNRSQLSSVARRIQRGEGMSKTKATQAADLYSTARENPYVQRLIEDEELRDSLKDAFEAARGAYGRIASNGGAVKSVTSDKKVQRDLRSAAESLRDASEQLRAPKKHKSRLGRLILLAIVGAVIALIVSEDARKTVLDALFGAEEEFEYTSTTSINGS